MMQCLLTNDMRHNEQNDVSLVYPFTLFVHYLMDTMPVSYFSCNPHRKHKERCSEALSFCMCTFHGTLPCSYILELVITWIAM